MQKNTIMQPQSPDEADYQFMTVFGASMQIRLAVDSQDRPELQIFGNRAGLLSLANILLWFVANSYRREFLSLKELPFVSVEGSLSVCIRMSNGERTGKHGSVSRSDRDVQFEWTIAEDDLQCVALLIHDLVSVPAHEYGSLLMADDSAIGIQIRMTDARNFI